MVGERQLGNWVTAQTQFPPNDLLCRPKPALSLRAYLLLLPKLWDLRNLVIPWNFSIKCKKRKNKQIYSLFWLLYWLKWRSVLGLLNMRSNLAQMGNRPLGIVRLKDKVETICAQTHAWGCRCVYLQLRGRVRICACLYLGDICHILQSAAPSQMHRQDSWRSSTIRGSAVLTDKQGDIQLIRSALKKPLSDMRVWQNLQHCTSRPFSGEFGKTSGINMYASNFIKVLVCESYSTYKKPFA